MTKGDKPGTWPQRCRQRAFVEGATWWMWTMQDCTPWSTERNDMEAEAVRRYGDPMKEDAMDAMEQRWQATCGCTEKAHQHGGTNGMPGRCERTGVQTFEGLKRAGWTPLERVVGGEMTIQWFCPGCVYGLTVPGDADA